MPDTNTVPAPEPSSRAPGAPETGSQSGDLAMQMTELRTRIAGFQTALNKKSEDAAAAALLAETATGQLTTLTKQVSDLTAERDNIQKEATTSKNGYERLKAIAQVNPVLLADDEQGLLRTDLTGEAFVNYLTTYANRLQTAIGQNNSHQAAGATPPAAGASRANGTPNKSALMGQLRDAQRKGDRAGVDSALKLLQQLETKQP